MPLSSCTTPGLGPTAGAYPLEMDPRWPGMVQLGATPTSFPLSDSVTPVPPPLPRSYSYFYVPLLSPSPQGLKIGCGKRKFQDLVASQRCILSNFPDELFEKWYLSYPNLN